MNANDFLNDPAKRASVRALTTLNPWWNLKILLFFVVWVLLGILVCRSTLWPVRLAGYFLIGAVMHGLAIFVHDAAHGLLSRNRMLNALLGFLTGLPTLVSATAYKVVHRPHHWYTREAGDPDEIRNVAPGARARFAVVTGWLAVGAPFYLLHVAAKSLILSKGTKARRIIVFEYMIILAIFVSTIFYLLSIGHIDVFVHAWLYPLFFAAVFVNVRGVAEHMLTTGNDPATKTRTVLSNPIVRFFLNNVNYHLDHHLVPKVPWYHLPQLHQMLREDYERAGAHISRSYTRLLLELLQVGPNGIAKG